MLNKVLRKLTNFLPRNARHLLLKQKNGSILKIRGGDSGMKDTSLLHVTFDLDIASPLLLQLLSQNTHSPFLSFSQSHSHSPLSALSHSNKGKRVFS